MIEIKADVEDALKVVVQIDQAINPLGPLLNKIGQDLADSTMARFPKGVAPDGTKWKAKSALTQLLYPRGGQRPLIGESKRLATTIAHQVHGNAVHVGSSAIYARIHQLGGTIKASEGKTLALGGYTKAKKSGTWAKVVNIPARPYLGMSTQDRSDTLETIRDLVLNLPKKN